MPPIPIQWTQSLHDVYVTLVLTDAANVRVHFTSTTFAVTCTTICTPSEEEPRESTVDLFDNIVPESSDSVVTSRSIRLRLRKATSSSEGGVSRPHRFWTRLTSAVGKKKDPPHITVHWDHWKDEEELRSQADDDAQGAQLAKAFGFKMPNGVSISGAGNPDVIAAMQRELLLGGGGGGTNVSAQS